MVDVTTNQISRLETRVICDLTMDKTRDGQVKASALLANEVSPWSTSQMSRLQTRLISTLGWTKRMMVR